MSLRSMRRSLVTTTGTMTVAAAAMLAITPAASAAPGPYIPPDPIICDVCVQNQPDLLVAASSYTGGPTTWTQDGTWHVIVTNQGPVDAGASTGVITWNDGTPDTPFSVGPLPSGARFDAAVPGPFHPNISATVNADHAVTESDYSNNTTPLTNRLG